MRLTYPQKCIKCIFEEYVYKNNGKLVRWFLRDRQEQRWAHGWPPRDEGSVPKSQIMNARHGHFGRFFFFAYVGLHHVGLAYSSSDLRTCTQRMFARNISGGSDWTVVSNPLGVVKATFFCCAAETRVGFFTDTALSDNKNAYEKLESQGSPERVVDRSCGENIISAPATMSTFYSRKFLLSACGHFHGIVFYFRKFHCSTKRRTSTDGQKVNRVRLIWKSEKEGCHGTM